MSSFVNAQPLLKAYTIRQVHQMQKDMLDNQSKPGNSYYFSEVMDLRTMPRTIFAKLASRAGFEHQQLQGMLERFDTLQRILMNNIKVYPQRQIYSDAVFQTLLREKSWKYASIEFAGHSVTEDAADLKEHLRYWIEMLKKYPNYEIAILENHQTDLAIPTFWELKDGCYFSMGAFDMNGDNSIIFLIFESMVMHAFEAYFNELWESIPQSCKNKDSVIERLEKYRQLL